MGEVYRARDTRLDRDVAIKVLPGAVASDPDRLARFEREARVLASLNHPHIATVFGFEESPAGKALVMELVDGEILKSPLPVAEALRVAIQIATALEAAHERGITHRDLKPANIMVTRAGIKLLDFGLARSTAPDEQLSATQTQTETIAGTASCMSPEKAQGRAVDTRSDIFAFGALLYETISGLRAFPGDSLASTLVSVLRDEPASAPRTRRGAKHRYALSPQGAGRALPICRRPEGSPGTRRAMPQPGDLAPVGHQKT
jgi:serine/threonine protein kinase